jgi:hypothetical protein
MRSASESEDMYTACILAVAAELFMIKPIHEFTVAKSMKWKKIQTGYFLVLIEIQQNENTVTQIRSTH